MLNNCSWEHLFSQNHSCFIPKPALDVCQYVCSLYNLILYRFDTNANTEQSAFLSSHIIEITQLKPWPVPFIVPEKQFPRALKEALHQKVELSLGLTSELTQAFYDEGTQYAL
jgi:hypothetical protein